MARFRREARWGAGLVATGWQALVDWFNGLALSENAILIGFAVAVGIVGALGVVAFYKLIDLAYAAFFRWPADYFSWDSFLAYRPALTAAGLALAWWTMRRFGRDHQGLNVPDVQLAVARRGGYIPTRPALVRTAASAITLGSGGSAGSEGPVAVLGSALGSALGRAFRFDPSRVKVLVAAGAAAGISAAFNAPLAGAFFALEEMLGSFAIGAFPPVVVSSVVAAVVSRGFFGNHPAFPIPMEYGYALAREVALFYPLLGIVTGLVAVAFIRIYFRTDSLARSLPVRPAALPWIGGALVGLFVLASHGILVGYGHLAVRLEVFGGMPWFALALLAAGKIFATSLTLNTGGSGGVFTPALYLGAATGGAFGVALAGLFPSLQLHPEAYALVGMGAVVAAATDAPITGILIVFEMTNDYAIVPPLMLATVIAYVVARRIEPDSLYSGWLSRRGERIEHGRDRDVLAGLCVADAYDPDPQVVGQAATVAQLLERLGEGDQTDFPVVDDALRFTGMITVAELGRIAKAYRELTSVLIAADVANPSETVAPRDSLLDVVRKMGVRGAAALPVVDPENGRLLGLISRGHILAVYERAIVGTSAGGPTEKPARPR
ncbi:MAG TPA: chloride channel protein [Longimicrobiales bacterium]